jgi:hypothetical protein
MSAIGGDRARDAGAISKTERKRKPLGLES